MSDYLTLTEFIPGTKAKAQEVNANFTAIKTALSEKAAMSGDSAQKFNVADATADTNAVNKKQLDGLSNDLSLAISKTGTKFCVKSGNTTNGKGDLFSYSVLQITPKIGGTYANLVISDYEGTQSTISSASSISMTGKPDGTYNIFISPTGTIYTLKNTIYRQQARPTMTDGDIWLDTSKVPFNCVKYDGTSDNKFVDVPLGKVTIASSLITAIETFPYNQNGYEININSFKKYDSGWFAVSANTTYTKTHNLGSSCLKTTVLYADNSDGTGFNMQVVVLSHSSGYTCTSGCVIANISNTTLQIKTGATDVAGGMPYPNTDNYAFGGDRLYYGGPKSSGYYRVLTEVA